MSVALLFITHQGIASNLLTVGESILQKTNSNLTCVEVPMDAPVDTIINSAKYKLAQLNLADGILFVTDIYGSTPGNIAQQLAESYKTSLLSGINLPMVIRLLNYRDEPEQILIQKALDGAHQGIQQYK